MIRLTELRLPLDHTPEQLTSAVLQRLKLPPAELHKLHIHKRSPDARKRSALLFVYSLDLEVADEAALLARFADDRQIKPTPDMEYRFVAQAPQQDFLRPVVVGFGPAGIFAALILAQSGFRPLVLERGKKVRERTQDTWDLWRKHTLHPESNVQFGEGGAGTFSDGKLYSQIKDRRHLGRKVLTEFVKAGAPAEILYVNRPHIGTFRLVSMVEKMRAEIERLGGEIRFQTRVEDLLIEDGQVRGVVLQAGTAMETVRADHVVLALGHSARDSFAMLYRRGVFVEAKAFAVGLRIEHPQSVIDRARYGDFAGHPLLGAADYKLVHHAANGRDVYSFCMCPGGQVVAATSEPGCVVTNGMSQYSRAERNANSALVVNVSPQDFGEFAAFGPLAGIEFQRQWERRAFELGGGNYNAPGQLVGDFLAGRPSFALGEVAPSYQPQVTPADLSTALPDAVISALREAIPAFARQIRGFAMDDAVLTGVETRTSSPLRITRGADGQSLNVKGLYPAGEGAGYAGGILSAAVDGIEMAEAVARAMSLSGAAPTRMAAGYPQTMEHPGHASSSLTASAR